MIMLAEVVKNASVMLNSYIFKEFFTTAGCTQKINILYLQAFNKTLKVNAHKNKAIKRDLIHCQNTDLSHKLIFL